MPAPMSNAIVRARRQFARAANRRAWLGHGLRGPAAVAALLAVVVLLVRVFGGWLPPSLTWLWAVVPAAVWASFCMRHQTMRASAAAVHLDRRLGLDGLLLAVAANPPAIRSSSSARHRADAGAVGAAAAAMAPPGAGVVVGVARAAGGGAAACVCCRPGAGADSGSATGDRPAARTDRAAGSAQPGCGPRAKRGAGGCGIARPAGRTAARTRGRPGARVARTRPAAESHRARGIAPTGAGQRRLPCCRRYRQVARAAGGEALRDAVVRGAHALSRSTTAVSVHVTGRLLDAANQAIDLLAIPT